MNTGIIWFSSLFAFDFTTCLFFFFSFLLEEDLVFFLVVGKQLVCIQECGFQTQDGTDSPHRNFGESFIVRVLAQYMKMMCCVTNSP